jgi:hypothetical protein
MSAPKPTSTRLFQPLTVIAGVVLGLIGLAWAGRAVTDRDWHKDFHRFHPMIAPEDFHRFHPMIAPESMYQPTIGEMRAIVRARCRPNQVLVIVGGNSILQGVGQPVEKLWSRHLQELLGDRFCVINFAFRGSSPTDGGALVAESLRDEFPRQIYIANVPPFSASPPAGHLDYRFQLFDAYYKGWLLDFPARNVVIKNYLAHPEEFPAAREQALGARFDARLRFRDFWNWWSLTRGFTFPTAMAPTFKFAYAPRNEFPDQEPDYELTPTMDRFLNKFVDVEMEITRNSTSPYYEKDEAGNWRTIGHAMARFDEYASTAFHDSLKPRTLIIVSANAPFYVRRLTPDEKKRDELAPIDTVTRWKALGYSALYYGPSFGDADFGDRTHLTSAGGRKLAALVAPEVRQLAEKLGYFPNPPRS